VKGTCPAICQQVKLIICRQLTVEIMHYLGYCEKCICLKEIEHGVLRDGVHTLHKGDIYILNDTRFYCTG
jgi:hypothetical protein